MTLKPGDTGPRVVDLLDDLIRVGFPLLPRDTFNPTVETCVRAFQQDHRLTVDGIVGPQTQGHLDAAPDLAPAYPDTTQRARRLSKMLLSLWDWRRFRMIPEYRSSDISAWQDMEAGKRAEYVVPLCHSIQRVPAATCGHTAWLLTEWHYRGLEGIVSRPHVAGVVNVNHLGRTPTWRTGRGGKLDGVNRFLPLLPAAGKMLKGKLHRGLSEYVDQSFKVDDLREIYDNVPLASDAGGEWHLCERDSGHIVLVVCARDGQGFADPRTLLPARPGAYRLAADSANEGTGQPWTFKRIEGPDVGKWTVYEMARLLDDGRPDGGPCAGYPDLPVVLEGE